MRSSRTSLALALVVATAAAPAWAEPTPGEIQAARALFAQAEKDEDAQHWAAALEKLKRASSVKMTAGIRFHIALCEEKLGHLVAALADYTASQQQARVENNKDVLDAVAEPLRKLQARVPTLTIQVPAVKGATVLLDGKPVPVGLWGIAMPVELGAHRVEARAPGKNAFTTTVTLAERETQTATVKLTDAPALPLDEGADATGATGGGTPGEGDGEGGEPDEGAGHHGRSRVGTIVATAATVAVAGFGVGAFFVADGKAGDLPATCAVVVDCGDAKSEIHTWDALALTSWIGAGALAVVSVVLWVLPSSTSSERPAARLVVRPGGAALEGSF